MAQTSIEMSPKLDPNSNEEIAFADRGCCFWIPCFRSDHLSKSRLWGRIPTADNEKEDSSIDHWWAKPLLKMREWSELVAGPKWKTFIHRFNKGRPTKQGKFQYDPLSYSLNFDEGPGENADLDDDRLRRDFSLRYASIPTSVKLSSSSVDLGKDNATSFP